jgi:hypothetical protein
MKRFISHKNLQKPALSIQALTVANLVPLFGVVFLGWDAAAIVLLYWIENLIIGLFNVLRMILVKVESPSKSEIIYDPLFLRTLRRLLCRTRLFSIDVF